jgi:hypothetical protein
MTMPGDRLGAALANHASTRPTQLYTAGATRSASTKLERIVI